MGRRRFAVVEKDSQASPWRRGMVGASPWSRKIWYGSSSKNRVMERVKYSISLNLPKKCNSRRTRTSHMEMKHEGSSSLGRRWSSHTQDDSVRTSRGTQAGRADVEGADREFREFAAYLHGTSKQAIRHSSCHPHPVHVQVNCVMVLRVHDSTFPCSACPQGSREHA